MKKSKDINTLKVVTTIICFVLALPIMAQKIKKDKAREFYCSKVKDEEKCINV